jgi:DNA modification methylase
MNKIEKGQLRINQLSLDFYGEFSLLKLDDAQLFTSIENEGILEPLTITRNNLVISGNRRLFVANCIPSITHVPVIYSDLKDSEIDELTIMKFNQYRIKNLIQLAREYEQIRISYGIKQGVKNKEQSEQSKLAQQTILKEGGVSKSTISRVLQSFKLKTNIEVELLENIEWSDNDTWAWLIEQNVTRKVEINTILKSLQNQSSEIINEKKASEYELYEDDFIHIIHGDSTNLKDVLADESVDCIPNSPPYFGAVRTYTEDGKNVKKSKKGISQTGHEDSVDDYVKNLMETYVECKRVLKPKGSIFVNVADTFKDGEIQNVPFKIIEAMKGIGLKCVQTMIWYKVNPQPVTIKAFQPTMEYILHFVKTIEFKWIENWFKSDDEFLGDIMHGDAAKKRRFRNVLMYTPPSLDEDNIPLTQGLLKTTSVNNNYLVKLLKSNGFQLQHNALFPLEVPFICIKSTTEKDDTVLDVFGGMSTTGLAAIINRCNYYGIDRSRVYSVNASIRIRDFLNQHPYLKRTSN